MEESEAELAVVEADSDALGADFITVELDTQPIEYVVKWAEVGSRFTIACVKKEAEDGAELLVPEDAFFAPYEEVYPYEVAEQSVEVKAESDPEEEDGEEEDGEEEEEDDDEEEEAGSSQVDGDSDAAEERQYHCNYCGKGYNHASSLYRHQQTHTGSSHTAHVNSPLEATPPDARYTCPHCSMSFKGSRMLGSHLRLHGKRRIHPCNICGKEFNHSSSLSRHRLIHKKGRGLPKEMGPELGGLPPRPTLKFGARKVKGGRRGGGSVATFYACPQCDLSFRSSAQLSKHQVTHVKELLHGYQDDLGHASSDLKIRLKLCSRDKPNVYTLCKKNRRGRRRRGPEEEDEDPEEGVGHVGGATTAGVGRHGCGLCGKRFSHASSLARHQQTHRMDGGARGITPGPRASGPAPKSKTYTCGTCNKTFMHSSSFSRHKKAHLQDGQRTPAHPAPRCPRPPPIEAAPLETDSE